jgi:hypothetical protein
MKKALVAYFSASGTTAGVAERLAKAIESDIFEIKPVIPYSKEDLNWNDKGARSTKEMNGEMPEPEIADKIEDIGQYEVVFIGFPIWWYREPAIIDKFVKSYDFTGKTIVPFVTSGGSGIGECGNNIKELVKGADVKRGQRFDWGIMESDMSEWAKAFI